MGEKKERRKKERESARGWAPDRKRRGEREPENIAPKSGAKNGTRPPYPLVFANKTAKMTGLNFFDLFTTEETLPGIATLLPSVGQ